MHTWDKYWRSWRHFQWLTSSYLIQYEEIVTQQVILLLPTQYSRNEFSLVQHRNDDQTRRINCRLLATTVPSEVNDRWPVQECSKVQMNLKYNFGKMTTEKNLFNSWLVQSSKCLSYGKVSLAWQQLITGNGRLDVRLTNLRFTGEGTKLKSNFFWQCRSCFIQRPLQKFLKCQKYSKVGSKQVMVEYQAVQTRSLWPQKRWSDAASLIVYTEGRWLSPSFAHPHFLVSYIEEK